MVCLGFSGFLWVSLGFTLVDGRIRSLGLPAKTFWLYHFGTVHYTVLVQCTKLLGCFMYLHCTVLVQPVNKKAVYTVPFWYTFLHLSQGVRFS